MSKCAKLSICLSLLAITISVGQSYHMAVTGRPATPYDVVSAAAELVSKPIFGKPVNCLLTITDQVKADLWNAHNTERKSHRKDQLGINEKLMVAAQKHAEWMAKRKRMSHTGAGGSKPWDRAKKEGYNFSNCGENIAYGQSTVAEVMKIWMHSAGHKANILGQYMEMGIGMAESENGTIYWVCIFGTPN